MKNNILNSLFGNEPEQQPAAADAIIRVNQHRCPQNHPCPSVRVCPTQALSQIGYGAPVADMEKCIQCGKCVRYCPMGAITLG